MSCQKLEQIDCNFSQNLRKHLLHEGSAENESIRLNYHRIISLIKTSIKIPKEMPTIKDIYQLLTFTEEPLKLSKKLSIKSFFAKTKAILFWLISAYECFHKKSLEIFVRIFIYNLYFF